MTPETKTIDQESTEEARMQEQSLLYVEDRSRSAHDVLTDQRQERKEDAAPAIFVP